MPRKVRVAREGNKDDVVNPQGQLPASTPTTNGAGGSAGGGNCPDGQIWNAETMQCEQSDTGNSHTRTIPSPVSKASAPVSEADTGVSVPRVAGSPLPDENDGDPKTPLHTGADGTEPEVKDAKITESEMDMDELGQPNADMAEEEGDMDEMDPEKKAEIDAIESAKRRIVAKQLHAKEAELDQRIREAKESAIPRALQTSTKDENKKVVMEAEIGGPSKWMRAAAAGQNVDSSYMWSVNKEKLFANTPQRHYKSFDAQGNEVNYDFGKIKASETVTGPPTDSNMRIMSEQVLVLPSDKVVTPIRQFCEVKILPPGTREARFFDFGPVTFNAITEGISGGVNEDGSARTVGAGDLISGVALSSPEIRASGSATLPRGTRIIVRYAQLEESPIDIVASFNRSSALESINDESVGVLDTAYNNDGGLASGDADNRKAVGGGTKAERWVSGTTGAQIAASDESSVGVLSFAGLLAAKGVIEDYGLDPSNLVCYTTGKGIRDVIQDANLDSYIGHSRPAIITEGTVERIAGINLVRSSAPADGSVAGVRRAVVFVPNAAFGLISGRDLTMEAQRRNELQAVHLTATQKIVGVVKNVEATCRISHT